MDSFSLIKKTVICQVCLKTLSSKQNLKQHMNIHTGEKPFKCCFPGCISSYKHASQLSNHRVLHQQYTKVATSSLDDIRTFIKLLIQALERSSVIDHDSDRKQNKKKRINLPCIERPQVGVVLPKFTETFSGWEHVVNNF